MSQTTYPRVDLDRIDAAASGAADRGGEREEPKLAAGAPHLAVRLWLVLPTSLLLCISQAVITILAENVKSRFATSTMIAVLAFGFMFLIVVLINPLLRVLFRTGLLRPANRPELVCIFAALIVTAGVSTFGLTSQLIPLIATPWNADWNTPQSGWSDQLLPELNPALYITDPEIIYTFREGVNVPEPPATADWAVWGDYYRKVFVAVPWRIWLSRVAAWMIFVAASYGMFYFLTYLVFQYWARREKLIFPLAVFSESMLPEADQPGRLPKITRDLGFWVGFSLAFAVLGYNAMAKAKWLGDLAAINLGMGAGPFIEAVRDTSLEGLTGKSFPMMFLIIFTAIGIAFLLPLQISFSAWFYFLMAKVFLLCLVWMNYGQDTSDFPTDWLWQNSAVDAQGAGGMLLFSCVSMFRCLREYARLALRRGQRFGDRLRVALPVVGLVICLAVMAFWPRWNSIPLLWSFVIVIFLTLLTVGLMRLVAEGGIYWFQAHSSFFHLYKTLGIGGWGAMGLKTALIGPLLLIYSVLYLDIKTFMAPNIMNAAKLHEDQGGSRAKFHVNLVTCILITATIAIGFTIYLAHLRGAGRMQSWFYTSGPKSFANTAYHAVITPPEFLAGTTTAYGIGAGWVAISMVLRRTLFWFPHPIGYIMLINPLLAHLWFSIFIGWICKKVVVKYGGKNTFDKVRGIFIGLILGELLAVCFWAVLTLVFDVSITGIDLNRYGP